MKIGLKQLFKSRSSESEEIEEEIDQHEGGHILPASKWRLSDLFGRIKKFLLPAAAGISLAILWLVPFEQYINDPQMVIGAHVSLAAAVGAIGIFKVISIVSGSKYFVIEYSCGHTSKMPKSSVRAMLGEGSTASIGKSLQIPAGCSACSNSQVSASPTFEDASQAENQSAAVDSASQEDEDLEFAKAAARKRLKKKIMLPAILAVAAVIAGYVGYTFIMSSGIIDSLNSQISGMTSKIPGMGGGGGLPGMGGDSGGLPGMGGLSGGDIGGLMGGKLPGM